MFILGTVNETPFSFTIQIIVLIVLLFCSALVSGSEVAFFSLKGEDREKIKLSSNKQEQRVNQLLTYPRELLATILIANNFINVGIVIISANVSHPILESFIENPVIRMLFELILISFVLLLFGEVIPKVYANKNALTLSKFMSKPLSIFGKTPPFSWVKKSLVQGTDFIYRIAKRKEIDVSTDDLEQAVELTLDDKTTEKEHKILEGIIKFGSTDVKQIMQARTESVCIEINTKYFEVLDVIRKCGFSRIPIYKETYDNIEGVLYVKDLLPYLKKDNDFKWNKLIRQPMFVPENKKIDDLLKDFQEKKLHLAIVVDEYGGTSGIVTLEDVLEEIVGDISNEFDEEDIQFTKINNSNFIFDGKTSLIDLYKVLNIDGKEFEQIKGESDSLAGFIIEQSGEILKENEEFVFENFIFTIEESDERKINKIKVTIYEKQLDNN